MFLNWLHVECATTLPGATQHHLDTWFARGPSTRQHARGFLRWAITNRIVHGLTLTRPVARSSPSISEDERLKHLRRVLLDDTLVLSHRLLAVLVLLFGQPVSRILKLRVDDVTLDDTRTLLRLSDDPVEVPEPAATLLRAYLADPRHRANTAAHTHSQTRWLPPGLMPGRARHATRAAQALRDLGIPARAARTGTWLHLVRQAPPSILAHALGISPQTAMNHAHRAGADYLSYPTLAPSATVEDRPTRNR